MDSRNFFILLLSLAHDIIKLKPQDHLVACMIAYAACVIAVVATCMIAVTTACVITIATCVIANIVACVIVIIAACVILLHVQLLCEWL